MIAFSTRSLLVLTDLAKYKAAWKVCVLALYTGPVVDIDQQPPEVQCLARTVPLEFKELPPEAGLGMWHPPIAVAVKPGAPEFFRLESAPEPGVWLHGTCGFVSVGVDLPLKRERFDGKDVAVVQKMQMRYSATDRPKTKEELLAGQARAIAGMLKQ